MRFSETFYIEPSRSDDWFDPILTVDTPLFIDPFLLYSSEKGIFTGSHADVIKFFNGVFKLIAESGGNHSSILWRKAESALLFPEVAELCLGYTNRGTFGAGSGRGFARVMADALLEAVQAGLTKITHFEEVPILREGIGADRISDITACLIRPRLANYTEQICKRHRLPFETVRYRAGYYDESLRTWLPIECNVPRNPYSGRPILLVPRRYLRDLPTINSEDFWEYCYHNENETLRNDYSDDVTRRVDKRTIIGFARRHPEIRRRYLVHVEQRTPQPYDYVRDKKGIIIWYDASSAYCASHPLALAVRSKQGFLTAVQTMLDEFKNYVENNRGWCLLWNENGVARKEDASQLLFLGVIKHYCKANNIDISRETNIGRGPVDFKVSQGYGLRALLEVKLAKNSRFWNGLTKQLPTYQKAEDIDVGYFLVVVLSDQDVKKLVDIRDRIREVNQKTGYEITDIIIDARRNPPSASRL